MGIVSVRVVEGHSGESSELCQIIWSVDVDE